MKQLFIATFVIACGSLLADARAADITVTMHQINDAGVGEKIGTIRAFDDKGGLRLVPRLAKLPPGERGFHVHETMSCAAQTADGRKGAGLGAGGHYDPSRSGKHAGPVGDGHLGDLPPLKVATDGTARASVLAPRLKVADLRGRAIVIHAGGDNFADQPQPLGGGGARIACGTIAR